MTGTWAAAGLAISPAQERAAVDAIAAAGGADAFDLVVLSGSLVAGHGHGYSDVDIYVVPVDDVAISRRVRFVDGVPVQFNPIDREKATAIALMFDRYRVTPEDRTQLFAMRRLLREASRLARGRLLHLTDEFAPVYRACDYDVIRRLVMTDCAREVGRHVEDAAGGRAAGDPLIALHGAETALRFAAEAVLAACGDVYVGESFFWRRLSRVDGDGALARRIWWLLKEGPAWDADPGTVWPRVDAIVELATGLVSTAQLEGWSAPLADFPVPAEPGPDSTVRRNALLNVIRFGDTFSIVGPDQAYRSNEATVREWLSPGGTRTGASTQRFLESGLLVR